MRFFFTEEDELARIRGTDIRSALVAARHEVIHGGPGDVAPVGTDVWMHGLRGDRRHPIEPAQLDALLATRAAVVLFQLCDASSMWFDRVPDALMQRTRLFLRNHWPSDRSGIPQALHGRIGWLPPMLKIFHRKFPNVSVQIVVEATRDPLTALNEGKIDLAIVSSDVADEKLSVEPIFDDELVAVVSPDHQLAAPCAVRRGDRVPFAVAPGTAPRAGIAPGLRAIPATVCGRSRTRGLPAAPEDRRHPRRVRRRRRESFRSR